MINVNMKLFIRLITISLCIFVCFGLFIFYYVKSINVTIDSPSRSTVFTKEQPIVINLKIQDTLRLISKPYIVMYLLNSDNKRLGWIPTEKSANNESLHSYVRSYPWTYVVGDIGYPIRSGTYKIEAIIYYGPMIHGASDVATGLFEMKRVISGEFTVVQ